MNKVNTNITLDPILKQQATIIFAKLGLDFSTGISLYLNQVVMHNGLPFALSVDESNYEPNEITLAAFAEEKEMRTNRKKYKRYKSFKELRDEIEREIANEK